MLQTFEAILNERGQIQFTEPIKLRRSGRVLVTMLTEQTETLRPLESETATLSSKSHTGLVEFFRHSPLHGLELDLTRSKDTGRNIVL